MIGKLNMKKIIIDINGEKKLNVNVFFIIYFMLDDIGFMFVFW